MFVLTELRDRIRIEPEFFNMKLQDALRDSINRKLANKVLLNVGLCICLRDITKLGDSLILPGDGATHTEVHFRYVIFRPQIGSILTGTIRSCSREGVHITLGFFDDIVIPPTALQHPSRFEEGEQAWVWEYPKEDGEKHDMFMDIGEPIRFRVSEELFQETSPIGPPVGEVSTSANKEMKLPYRIIGAINEPGLGVLSWWSQNSGGDEEEEEEEDDEEEEADVDDDEGDD